LVWIAEGVFLLEWQTHCTHRQRRQWRPGLGCRRRRQQKL